MKSFFTNYATDRFLDAQKASCLRAIEAGFDEIIPCGPYTLDEQFKKDHAVLLSNPIGAGFWIWKPYIILKTMLDRMDTHDFILYMDASDEYNEDIRKFATGHLNDQGQFFIQTGFFNRNFVRKKCFQVMGCDAPEYWNGKQVEAGCIGMLKNSFNISFLQEWLKWCTTPDAIMRLPYPDPDTQEGFFRHSCDQGILSLMIIRDKLLTNDNSVANGRINYNAYG